MDRWRIDDWRRYPGLWAPPPGYYWMRYGDQFLLTAIAGGLIGGVVAATVRPGYGYSPY